jgi:SAM-dependent methyltransferase
MKCWSRQHDFLCSGFRPKGNEMTKDTQFFSDGAAYELLMGRWSRPVGEVFLDWVAPPRGARWLDIGCGTGVFTELVLETCAPAAVVAVDPSAAQIDIALAKPVAQRADFRVADAQALAFPDGAFDIVASSLVINFIPDRPKAIAEMRRVCHPGGIVAGYVWDFAGERGPGSPIRVGLRRIGVNPPTNLGVEDTRLNALASLFANAGLKDISTRVIDVTVSFPNFDEFWRTQTPGFNPMGKMIAALPGPQRENLINLMRENLPADADGSITCSAHAHAIKAYV